MYACSFGRRNQQGKKAIDSPRLDTSKVSPRASDIVDTILAGLVSAKRVSAEVPRTCLGPTQYTPIGSPSHIMCGQWWTHQVRGSGSVHVLGVVWSGSIAEMKVFIQIALDLDITFFKIADTCKTLVICECRRPVVQAVSDFQHQNEEGRKFFPVILQQ